MKKGIRNSVTVYLPSIRHSRQYYTTLIRIDRSLSCALLFSRLVLILSFVRSLHTVPRFTQHG